MTNVRRVIKWCNMLRSIIKPVAGHSSWYSLTSRTLRCDLLLVMDCHADMNLKDLMSRRGQRTVLYAREVVNYMVQFRFLIVEMISSQIGGK